MSFRYGLVRPGTPAGTGRMRKIINKHRPWDGGTAPAPWEPPSSKSSGPLSDDSVNPPGQMRSDNQRKAETVWPSLTRSEQIRVNPISFFPHDFVIHCTGTFSPPKLRLDKAGRHLLDLR